MCLGLLLRSVVGLNVKQRVFEESVEPTGTNGDYSINDCFVKFCVWYLFLS